QKSTAEQTDDDTALAILLDFDNDTGEHPDAAHGGEVAPLADNAERYRAFTTVYDNEQPVTQLVRPQQLTRFRAELDQSLDKLHINQRRLARYFHARLSVADNSAWRFGEEEGHIDGRRL